MVILVFAVLVVAGMGLFFFIWQMKGQQSHVMFKQEIEALRSDFRDSLHNLVTQVNERLKDNTTVLGERLDNTAKVVNSVSENLGRLREASTRIFEIGKDISSLQELLRAPKIRGGMGEYFLGDLLSQVMPKEFYETQRRFKNGQIVDAVIKFGQGLVPVDSKFPLENFKTMISASTEEEKRAAKKLFVSDVKKHILDISMKYILPDEGTFDFALMYIPAENVYYEMIIKDEKLGEGGSIFNYALSRKVIPVSPNSFYAYLQVILLGLKGMAIEKSTQQILSNLDRLKGDFERFTEEFGRIGKHLSNSRGSFEDAEKRLLKLQEKIVHLGGLKEEKVITNDQKIIV